MSNIKCVYCDGKLTPFRIEKVTDANDEIMFVNSSDIQNLELSHGKCVSCGSIVAMDMRMTEDNHLLNAYTEGNYVNEKLNFIKHISFYKKIESLINPSKAQLSICDVGCNSGSFLEMLEKGWKKFGVELNHAAIKAIDKKEIEVHQGVLSNSDFPKQSIDILTYLDVFEHLQNPRQEIENAKNFLSPSGKIVILTGNSTSLTAKLAGATWSYLGHVGHIAVPSKDGLIHCLKKSGFTNITIDRMNHPYSRSILHWLIILCIARIMGTPPRITIGSKRLTVPLFFDHILIVASR
jgi:SAM-dependent methyltransferase